MDTTQSEATTKTLAETVREIYLDRRDGMLELEHDRGTESLFFRGGELFLDRDHDLARQLAPMLAEVPADGRPAAHDGLREVTESLARQVASQEKPNEETRSQDAFAELIGPLPTVTFVTELAIHGRYEEDLLALLGGAGVKLRSNNDTPALQQLPGLLPEMAQMLARCEHPSTVTDLLRATGSQRLSCLRGLVKLWALGLVGPADVTDARGEKLVTPRVLRTFADRVESLLVDDPLVLDTEEHRARLAKMMETMGQQTHYQLFDLDPRSGDDEISNAYHRLARLTHPSHATRLGLAGKEKAISVLFEHVTEAYLTLSDPMRRASYNTVSGIQVAEEVGDEKRRREKQQLARQNYRRATRHMEQMDYSMAVDLLKEAARMDPQPEYFVRLGVAQSKNPHWQHHALASFEEAVALSPDDAGVLTAYGAVLEHLERFDEARAQYEAAISKMPDHVAAREALDRLGGATAVNKSSGDFRSLFKARD